MPDSLRRFKAGIFQALAHPTRIAIVELLRDEGEVSVSRIYEQLKLEQANASQHLAVMRGKQIVVGRKEGNQVFYSLRDAILGTGVPFIEVHLSNTHAREPFRRHSYLSDIAVGVITGLGAFGYEAAVRAAAQRLAPGA